MRAVDGIDVALELAPRRWVQAAVVVLFGWMYLTGNYAPINWYLHQKTEQFVEIMMKSIPSPAPASSDAATALVSSGSALVTAR